ncbi:MAG: MarR family transcriptional regulator [Bacilli bacterium]|nr:MarR family transcriptional regulator [Bacilli bacterium]
MNTELRKLKDEFLMYLYEISKMKMVGYIANFIQGEDALMLRLFLNGPMTPKELSEELKVTKGRVTAIINKLKNKKYVDVKTNDEDRRSVTINLSNLGREYFQGKLDIADNYFDNVFSVLGLDDSKNLVMQIENLLTKVKEANI